MTNVNGIAGMDWSIYLSRTSQKRAKALHGENPNEPTSTPYSTDKSQIESGAGGPASYDVHGLTRSQVRSMANELCKNGDISLKDCVRLFIMAGENLAVGR